MEVKQIATILNETIVPEALGSADIQVSEDLSNIVTVGKDVTQYLTVGNNLDNGVKKILNKVGKTINWNRPYIGMSPNILRDSWEYGSILEKNRAALAEAKANDTWSLTNGTDYLDGTYYAPQVSSKLFNKSTTFEIDISFGEKQFRESFLSRETLASFFGMIESRITDSMTVALDALTMRVLNNFALEHFKENKGVVNLLAMYNTTYTQSLTAQEASTDKDFLRFAAYQILLFKSRMRGMGKQFNLEDFDTHTPYDKQMLIMHSDFAKGFDIFLQSDTYHNELVSVGEYRDVPYWQSAKGFTYNNSLAIAGKPASGEWTYETMTFDSVSCNGVIGMLIDRDACAICREDMRVTSQYVPKAEFVNSYYKNDCSYLNDLAENGIIFTVENPVAHQKQTTNTTRTKK